MEAGEKGKVTIVHGESTHKYRRLRVQLPSQLGFPRHREYRNEANRQGLHDEVTHFRRRS
jgi:hypothetical protein